MHIDHRARFMGPKKAASPNNIDLILATIKSNTITSRIWSIKQEDHRAIWQDEQHEFICLFLLSVRMIPKIEFVDINHTMN